MNDTAKIHLSSFAFPKSALCSVIKRIQFADEPYHPCLRHDVNWDEKETTIDRKRDKFRARIFFGVKSKMVHVSAGVGVGVGVGTVKPYK